MRLKQAVHNGIEVFQMEGEIDLHHITAFRPLLRAKIRARCPALILDLSGVRYIDSAGMSAITEYFRDAARHDGILGLCCLTGDVEMAFHIVRLDRTIPMFTTLSGAIAAIRHGNIHPPAGTLFERSQS